MKSAAPACRRELPDGIIALEIRVRTRVDFDVLVCEGAVTHAVVARFEVAGTDVASQLSRVQTWVRDDGAPLAKQDGGCGDCLGGSYGRRAVLCGRFAGPRVHPGYHEQSAETIDFGPYHDLLALSHRRDSPGLFLYLRLSHEKIFEREGCPMCHTPPLYTSNMLMLAQGFEPPIGCHADIRHSQDIGRHRPWSGVANAQGDRLLRGAITQRCVVSKATVCMTARRRAWRRCSTRTGSRRPMCPVNGDRYSA